VNHSINTKQSEPNFDAPVPETRSNHHYQWVKPGRCLKFINTFSHSEIKSKEKKNETVRGKKQNAKQKRKKRNNRGKLLKFNQKHKRPCGQNSHNIRRLYEGSSRVTPPWSPQWCGLLEDDDNALCPGGQGEYTP